MTNEYLLAKIKALCEEQAQLMAGLSEAEKQSLLDCMDDAKYERSFKK